MSKVQLFFNPMDARSRVEYDIAEGTQLIDFLQEHYPVGFDGALIVLVGTDQIDLDDLDYEVGDADLITMLVMPAGDPATQALVVDVLIRVAVAAAVSLTINFLFGPSSPKSGSTDESPTYSINATRNESRLGSPIASHYGRVSHPPPFSAAPYVFYAEESNDMFVDELLCLGQGKYIVDISDIYIGDTPVSALEAGTVEYWIYGPDDHMETLGTIEADIWSKVENSGTPYHFYENLFTSPEVESYEFNDDVSDEVLVPVAFSGVAKAANVDPDSGLFIAGSLSGIPDTTQIGVGDTLNISGTSNNDGIHVVNSVVDNGDGTLTLFERLGAFFTFKDENPINGTYLLNSNTTDMIAGPYRAQKIGQKITEVQCDIVFPQGLMDIDGDGDQNYTNIDMVFTAQQIKEDDGSAIGAPVVVNKTYHAKQRNALRSTVSIGPLTPGAYEVSVERTTPFADAGRDIETTIWSGLKGVVQLDTEQRVYGPTTQMAIRMKATNALGSAARARVRVTATRVLDSGESDNPIVVFRDIWTNQDYGMRRDISETDEATLDELEILYEPCGGPRFNGSFDQKSTGWESLVQAVSMCGAKVIQNNALTTVVQDGVQDVRTAMFTTANIVQESLNILYTFDPDGDFDGVTVEYRDPDTFVSLYVTYPSDATSPEKFNLFGCTDDVYASQFAAYLWNIKSLRRKVVTFTTELEGLIPVFGDRIGVSHSMPDWGQSGVFVEKISETSFRVDQALDWDKGNYIILRDQTGKPTSPVLVARGVTRDVMNFSEAPPITIYPPGVTEPTSYSFGTQYTVIRDFMVSKMTPQSETAVGVQGHVYDDKVYDGAPPHMGVTPWPEERPEIPDADITGIAIWDETDADLPIFYRYGVVGIDGDEIIAAPSGRKIIHSINRGQTWDEYPNSLPDDPSVAGDAAHLVPSKWVKANGRWYAHLRSRESNNANNGAVIGYTVDGSSWTIGPKLSGAASNGRYSTQNLIIDVDNSNIPAVTRAVLFGRPNDPNNVEAWKYEDDLGETPNALNQFSIAYNSNGVGGISNWQDSGYLAITFQSGNNLNNLWAISKDCDAGSWYENYTWGSTTSGRFADNGAGVAVFGNTMNGVDIVSDGFAVLTTDMGYTDPIVTASRDADAGGEVMIASKDDIWLAAGTGSAGSYAKWGLEYSLETAPTEFLYPCDVILPVNHTSSGSNGSAWWVGPSNDGWWVGWYRKSTDQKVIIFKFQFENFDGECP